jgi:hypothetical protein
LTLCEPTARKISYFQLPGEWNIIATVPFLLGWARSFPSAQQACRSLSQGTSHGWSLKGAQSATTGEILTHSQSNVLSLILFVNCSVFFTTEVLFFVLYILIITWKNTNVKLGDHSTWSKLNGALIFLYNIVHN